MNARVEIVRRRFPLAEIQRPNLRRLGGASPGRLSLAADRRLHFLLNVPNRRLSGRIGVGDSSQCVRVRWHHRRKVTGGGKHPFKVGGAPFAPFLQFGCKPRLVARQQRAAHIFPNAAPIPELFKAVNAHFQFGQVVRVHEISAHRLISFALGLTAQPVRARHRVRVP